MQAGSIDEALLEKVIMTIDDQKCSQLVNQINGMILLEEKTCDADMENDPE